MSKKKVSPPSTAELYCKDCKKRINNDTESARRHQPIGWCDELKCFVSRKSPACEELERKKS